MYQDAWTIQSYSSNIGLLLIDIINIIYQLHGSNLCEIYENHLLRMLYGQEISVLTCRIDALLLDKVVNDQSCEKSPKFVQGIPTIRT